MVQLIVTAGYQSSILEFSGDYRISGARDGLLGLHRKTVRRLHRVASADQAEAAGDRPPMQVAALGQEPQLPGRIGVGKPDYAVVGAGRGTVQGRGAPRDGSDEIDTGDR